MNDITDHGPGDEPDPNVPGPNDDELIYLALAELTEDALDPVPFEDLTRDLEATEMVASDRTRRVAIGLVILALIALIPFALARRGADDLSTVSPDPAGGAGEEALGEGALRIPESPYLPSWVPDGFELTAVRRFDQLGPNRPPDPLAIRSITLGDSDVHGSVLVVITARRFATPEDFDRARWLEDASMVSGGGPTNGLSVDGAVFAYDGLDEQFATFHGSVDESLVAGFVQGQLPTSALARLLSTLSIAGTGAEMAVELDAGAGGLTVLDDAPGLPMGFGSTYTLDYRGDRGSFSIQVGPGATQARVIAGSPYRVGERLESDRGMGFFEAQPEVGGALGSRRLAWWVPTASLSLWVGDTLRDDEALRMADSFGPVTAQDWTSRTAAANAETVDLSSGPLPEDPQQTLEDRLNETETANERVGDRPDLDVDTIADFVGELRGGRLPTDAAYEWIGPVEADQATASADFLPADVWHVFRALGLVDTDDDRTALAEARRRDVRGGCCVAAGVSLIEGMDADEASVVLAHELTHLYDTQVLGAKTLAGDELIPFGPAVLEGNATRVMRAFRDLQEIDLDLDGRSYEWPDMPSAVRRLFRFAYLDGERFVDTIATRNGEEAVDRLLTDSPPVSTEHILVPDRYLAGDLPLDVEPPSPPDGATVTARSTLGAFVVALAAEQELGWPAAVELAGTWAGDGYVAWTEGEGELNCVAATIVFDDDGSARRFATAVDATARANTVELRSCG